MSPSRHPTSSFERVLRVREHTLVDLCDLLGADAFSLTDGVVIFTRRAGPGRPVERWSARLGDWCVCDNGCWRFLADSDVPARNAPTHGAGEGVAPAPVATPGTLLGR